MPTVSQCPCTVSQCPQCRNAHSVAMPTVSQCPQCRNAHSVAMPTVSQCPRCHNAHGVTMPTVSQCPRCHNAHGVTMPTVSQCPRCHNAYGVTMPPNVVHHTYVRIPDSFSHTQTMDTLYYVVYSVHAQTTDTKTCFSINTHTRTHTHTTYLMSSIWSSFYRVSGHGSCKVRVSKRVVETRKHAIHIRKASLSVQTTTQENY